MMSNMFDALGGSNRLHKESPVQQLKSNPAEFLKSKGFQVPEGVDMRSPQSIINGLIQSGQIGNGRLQQAIQMVNRMTGR